MMEEVYRQALAEFHANARRIVACVNALAGIPDPAAYVKACENLIAAAEVAKRTGYASPVDVQNLADALTATRAAKGEAE